MNMRLLTEGEARLLRDLLRRANLLHIYKDQIADWMVEDMDDGGMGSVRLHRREVLIENTEMDRKVSELQFRDSDGVLVIASLILNIVGFPFEVDLLKVNSEPLQMIPEQDKFMDVEYTNVPNKAP